MYIVHIIFASLATALIFRKVELVIAVLIEIDANSNVVGIYMHFSRYGTSYQLEIFANAEADIYSKRVHLVAPPRLEELIDEFISIRLSRAVRKQ